MTNTPPAPPDQLHVPSEPDKPGERLRFVWMDVTRMCQLDCGHCYAEAGPGGTHGVMTSDDWIRAIDQVAALGTNFVQFIGGEPTLHPELPGLVTHALGLGIEVEIYTNLVHVRPHMWELFARSGVRLATSYYTDDPEQHYRITGRKTLVRTRANIAHALALQIPLRVGLINMGDNQRIEQAMAQLAELGVTNMDVDRMRLIGRPAPGARDCSELCGRCGDGIAAVLPDGSVTACPLGRWLKAGDVRQHAMADLYADVNRLAREAGVHGPLRMPVCPPDGDGQCEPKCRPGCDPALGCRPPGGDPPPPPDDDD